MEKQGGRHHGGNGKRHRYKEDHEKEAKSRLPGNYWSLKGADTENVASVHQDGGFLSLSPTEKAGGIQPMYPTDPSAYAWVLSLLWLSLTSWQHVPYSTAVKDFLGSMCTGVLFKVGPHHKGGQHYYGVYVGSHRKNGPTPTCSSLDLEE